MRSPDLFDQAQELEALQRDDAIERARWHGQGCSAEVCERCGGDIPEGRRQALPVSYTHLTLPTICSV